jgi:PAS domain S-box-containing protein
MSTTAKAYIGLFVAVGCGLFSRGLLSFELHDTWRFIAYLALAIPASCLKVRLPGVTGTMSVLFLFILAGIAELGLPETLVIGGTCGIVQSFWHAQVRPRPIQVIFSVADLAFAITAADMAYRSPALLTSYLDIPFRLAAAAIAFFVANTFPVAAVIALTESKSIRQVWRQCYFWSFPYYLVGAAIVGAFGFANRLLDWQAWLLILPVVYGIFRSYQMYLDQLKAERTRAEEQRQHAEQVDRLHARAVESLAKLQAVIQASPLAIVALGRSGIVTSWNTQAERMLGWTAEEAIGRAVLFQGDGGRELEVFFERGLQGEAVSDLELTHARKDGSSFAADVWTAPFRDPEEHVSGVLVTVADISDRKRLEEQLRLSQKMEAVGRLAGGIAHDFNNLLTVINGFGSMLEESVRYDPNAAGQLQEILGAGNRAADLVSRLLTFSRRQMIAPKRLEVNSLVKDVDRMLRRVLGEHIEFRIALGPDAGYIRADRNQVETALINLATNARDAMPDGGSLVIETAGVEVNADQQQQVRNLPDGLYSRIIVRDSGHGMDANTLEHIFEPFFTTKETGKGTGLGLSSVYGGVQQNRGRIFVDTEIGKGTTFTIYLPQCQEEALVESSRVASPQISRGSEVILVVEDEAALRHMIREALCKAGYRVREAQNGADALELWGSHAEEIDLVVTDVVMPVMSGVKLAQ